VITRVVFDVHGAIAADLQARALERLAAFDPDVDLRRWTLTIDVHEETVTGDGTVALWRGEVEARRHGPPR
jgi:hypothetical protein